MAIVGMPCRYGVVGSKVRDCVKAIAAGGPGLRLAHSNGLFLLRLVLASGAFAALC
jgi:hypothetical protein